MILASKARLCLFRKFKPFSSYFWIDGVQVENIGEKAKNTCSCSKIPLHKNFKLVLEQNVSNPTYHKIRFSSQKCINITLSFFIDDNFRANHINCFSRFARNFFSARKGESPILEFSLAEEDLDSDTCALLNARNVAQAAVALKLPVKSHFGMGKSYIYVWPQCQSHDCDAGGGFSLKVGFITSSMNWRNLKKNCEGTFQSQSCQATSILQHLDQNFDLSETGAISVPFVVLRRPSISPSSTSNTSFCTEGFSKLICQQKKSVMPTLKIIFFCRASYLISSQEEMAK